MNHAQLPLADVHVQLYSVHAQGDGAREARQGVLGGKAGGAPMTDDEKRGVESQDQQGPRGERGLGG